MADVQLEHGHLKVANRLFEAVTYAGFSGTQTKIVLCLIRMTYGWRQRSVRASHHDLAVRCGFQGVTGGFRRELDALIRVGVVLELDRAHGRTPSLYAVNKDFEKWGTLSVPADALDMLHATRPSSDDRRLSLPQKGQDTDDESDAGSLPQEGQSTSIEGAHRGQATDNQGALVRRSLRPTEAESPPNRGRVTGSNSNENADVGPPKDIERHERHKNNNNSGNFHTQDYAIRLTAAANAGIEKRWGEQPNILTFGGSTQLAHDLAQAGVKLETAVDAIAKVCAVKRGEKPGSIEYFRNAIIGAHQVEQQRDFERVNRPAPTNGPGEQRGGEPRPISTLAIHQTYSPVAEREEFDRRTAYDKARSIGAAAWAQDPANADRYALIVAAANSEHHAILTTSFGKRARDKTIALRCAEESGFPAFEAWCAANPPPSEPVSAGHSPPNSSDGEKEKC